MQNSNACFIFSVLLLWSKPAPLLSSFSARGSLLFLRYYYRLLGMNKNAIALPSLKKDTKLPVILTPLELKKYLVAENPHIWLFNGKESDGSYSVRGLSWVMRENLKKTSITKEVNLHSLRHSYATHLLEQGLNIVTLKELLGHAQITTTMIYLHVAQCELLQPHSPLDTLYIYPGNADKL
jgi:hypothetical protein